MEHMARMGEWVVSDKGEDVLSCIGLGSCIGLALLDRRAGIAGLAHVMLPESPSGGGAGQNGKYADLAVPELIAAVIAKGGAKHRFEAVLVGGAQMFAFGSGSGRDIGGRNTIAVTEQLKTARINVRATATGGSKGRSMKVVLDGFSVTCREAAGQNETLIGAPGVALAA